MDHKAEFTLLTQKAFGHEVAESIEWSSPRLLCIAGDFTKYDEHAVQQIPRNIELLRYRRYGDGLLLLELVNATTSEQIPKASAGVADTDKGRITKGFAEILSTGSGGLTELWEALRTFLLSLGDDVQTNQLKHYVAFRRIKNFACVVLHTQSNEIVVTTRMAPSSVALEEGFTRDLTGIGHAGTGDLEIRVRNQADLERAKPLIRSSYELS